jgi:hypothetical protein
MATRFQMVTRRQFGFSNKARLNPALVAALRSEGSICQTCRDIEKEVDAVPEGGDYVEAASFPGKTVQKLDAHFKSHWKDEYELVDLAARKGSP